MCRPPDIVLPSVPKSEGDEAGANEEWGPESPTAAAGGWAWGNEVNGAEAAQPDDLLAAQERAILLKYGHTPQQQQQQFSAERRLAQLAAITQSRPLQPGATGWGGLARAVAKNSLSIPADVSTGVPAADPTSMPWLAGRQLATAPRPMWPGISTAAAYVPAMPAGLVAQGIPCGMTQMGGMDPLGGGHVDHTTDDDCDPKKYKRMMSNRASAKRSRQRRQERLDELEIVSAKLQVENSAVQRKLHEATERIKKFQQENLAVEEEVKSLKSLLESKHVHLSPAQPGHVQPATTTKQDSCGATTASTTERPSSDPSAMPSSHLLGKRSREEMAESRLEGGSGSGSEEDTSSPTGLVIPKIEAGVSPVTPTSGSKDGQVCDPQSCPPPTPVANEAVVLGANDMVMLDDDLFNSFMDECFSAKAAVV